MPAIIPTPLGIVMLDTQFSRPKGDVGNPDSWPFPVVMERVEGAFAGPVVSGTHRGVEAFIDAGQRLVDRGACAVTTSCGFLVRHQRALETAIAVPVVTSTLLSYSALQRKLGRFRSVVILTIDKAALDSSVRASADIPDDALVFELPGNSHFRRAILDAACPLDPLAARAEWVDLALTVQREHPNVGHWLFECANMPPYADAVAVATGLDVYDALTMGRALYQSATP